MIRNGRGVFLDSDGNSAFAVGTKTVSYPPVSGTGMERYTESASTTEISTASTNSISTAPYSVTPQATSLTSSAPTATGTSAASNSPQDDNDDSDTKIGLGVGLGVPLAAIAAGLSVWFVLRRKRRPNGPRLAGSDNELQNGSRSRGSDDRTPNGSPYGRSDYSHSDGSHAASAMLATSRPKNELSGEGKPIHELQSLALPPGYQRPQYPNSGSTDLRPPTHVSYELP